MPWVIAAVVVVLLLMARKTANASIIPTPANFTQRARITQLSGAIAEIEGGTPQNQGNIRAADGSIAQSASLSGMMTRAFLDLNSSLYTPDMTFKELAWMYVAGTTPGDWTKVDPRDNPDNWAHFVAGKLGVSVDSSVGDFINS